MGLEGFENFFGVALWFDLGEDLEQGLVGADYEGSALDADDFLAVHVLFFEYPKLIADFFVYICEQCVGQVVLFAEFTLGFGGVAGDSEHDCSGGLEFFEGIAEAAGFDGATRGIGLRVEEEYDGFSGEVG